MGQATVGVGLLPWEMTVLTRLDPRIHAVRGCAEPKWGI
jgi:hypothetical protein